MASLVGLKYRFDMDIVCPVSTLLGYWKLKKISIKNDIPQWHTSFHLRKVLIVGTGPSLDKVENDYFSKFDTIVYINHAIKLAGLSADEYFFSTDINAIKRIKDKEYCKKLLKLERNRLIIAPIHFNSILSLRRNFISNFSFIAASKPMYKKVLLIKTIFGFSYSRFIYWPEQPNIKRLESWFSKFDQVLYFPVIESTSALSAILFAAKYCPQSITLIGCDFSESRSKLIINEQPARDINPFSESKKKFLFLQRFLKEKGIKVENSSWYVE